MPVILEPAAWPVWLGETPGDHLALLRPAGAGVVRLWPVSRAVNSVRNNGADLLAPMDDAGPAAPADAPMDMNPADRMRQACAPG
jgi:putative SOS response-associated peptidase YedK